MAMSRCLALMYACMCWVREVCTERVSGCCMENSGRVTHQFVGRGTWVGDLGRDSVGMKVLYL